MSIVYQTAAGVVVWLGSDDGSTAPAMDLIKRVVELDYARRLQLNYNDVSSENSDPLLNSGKWRSLTQFFQREWFNRTWM
jgi:hypothetical protein